MAGKQAPEQETVVEILFTGKDSGLSKIMAGLGKQATGTEQQLSGMMSTFKQMAGAYIGMSTVKSIMAVGQAAEQAKISLGGILSGQGIAKNFNAGMFMARDTLIQVEEEAAALPGTAEEFQKAFQTAAGAIGTSGLKLKEFVTFADKLVAVGKVFGEDAAQSGRDIALLIQGRAGMDVTLWNKLAPYMGMAVSEAHKFNKMIPKERMEKLMAVVGKGGGDMGKLGDMLKEYGNTWDAISSTIESTMKVLWRAGTAPLFEKAKGNAKMIADWLGDHEDLLKTLAGRGGAAVSNMLTPSAMIGMAGSVLGKVAFGFGPVGMAVAAFATQLAVGGKSLDGLSRMAYSVYYALEPLYEKFTEFTDFFVTEITPALNDFITTVGEAAYEGLKSFVDILVNNKQTIADAFNLFISMLQAAAEKLKWVVGEGTAEKPGMRKQIGAKYDAAMGNKGGETEAEGWSLNPFHYGRALWAGGYAALSGVSTYATGGEFDTTSAAGKYLQTQEDMARVAKEEAARAAGEAALTKTKEDIDRMTTMRGMDVFEKGTNPDWKPGMGAANVYGTMTEMEGAGATPQQIADLMHTSMVAGLAITEKGDVPVQYGKLLVSQLEAGIAYAKDNQGVYSGAWVAYLQSFLPAALADPKRNDRPEEGTPKKPSVNQDFRHSRFDIKNQFPEGVDPDRIAVAFASDLQALGYKKLQSPSLSQFGV